MPRHLFWINPTNVAKHAEDNDEARRLITRAIDRNGWDWQIWAVASSGFFTDSYNLFATNVILPSLAFVYWPNVPNNNYESYLNIATLAGSLVGQLLFGFLADRYGRRKLYGLELMVVIVATIGVAQSSKGIYTAQDPDNSSMSVLGWLMFWRILVGVGIGAEYPLSAVITAEFAPVQQRARMMAAVFLMQPIGQLAAQLVGLGAIMGMGASAGLNAMPSPTGEAAAISVDRIWRVVIGVGAFPAFVAILFRITIPESPRFTLDVEHDADRAIVDTQMYFPSEEWNRSYTADGRVRDEAEEMNGAEMADLEQQRSRSEQQEDIGWPAPDEASLGPRSTGSNSVSHTMRQKSVVGTQFTRKKLVQYFWIEGNGRYLVGTASCWFLLDVAFYGLGINNPRTIASLWDSLPAPRNTSGPGWETDPDQPSYSIYQVLVQDAQQSAITISIGSVIGSLVILKAIDYVPRKNFLAWSFLALAGLLIITGGSLFKVFHTSEHAVTIVFYALSQFVFNLGPNTLTFIIPAEIFPTRYRATCYGISAAAGKLGSIVVQLILLYTTPTGTSTPSAGQDMPAHPSNHLAIILVVFSVLMALGAFTAWTCLPDIQEATRARGFKLPSKTLEDLAVGRIGTRGNAPPSPALDGAERRVGAGFWSLLRRKRGRDGTVGERANMRR